MRLAKYLAHAGVASRRAAEKLVGQGRVTVAGEVVRDPARDVEDSVEVAVDGASVSVGAGGRIVYVLHKPAGVVSTARDPGGRPTVVDLVKSDERLYPVGRLDAPTTGLILLTNDGDLAYRLTHPSFEVPKTYRARLRNPPISERVLRALREGVALEDGMTAPARVRRLAPDAIELTIHEGRKRQVRRMCEAVGHPTVSLQRIAFGPLRIDDLAPGAYRKLTRAEVERLSQAAASRPEPPQRSQPPAGPARARPAGARVEPRA